jgi:sterol desaturase/sphingolipid hydroxylase (fatty acid hydroxylase superfamily)
MMTDINYRRMFMLSVFRKVIFGGAYPIIFGLSSLLLLLAASQDWAYWPIFPAIAATGIACVAFLETIQPYEKSWQQDHSDTLPDTLHAVVSLSLIFATAEVVTLLLRFMPVASVWPTEFPTWLQVFLAGLVIDFGLWLMHWLSHRNQWLWKFHALHHSSERLYWLNGERRHPVSALLLATPGISVAVLLGAPPIVIGCWMSIMSVHLAFQHANIDYSIGPFRRWLAAAEIHRWHHKRDYEDAQVNFGEFFIIWDRLFGTYRDQANGVVDGDVGIREDMPKSYLKQLAWPFT